MTRYCVQTITLSNDVEIDRGVLHATETESAEEATAAAKAAAEAHQDFGWNEEWRGWWGRNAGGVTVLFRARHVAELGL